jgi:hypothetical protein
MLSNLSWFRVQRKLRLKWLAYAGARVGNLISVNIDNAQEVARRYSGVAAQTLLETAPPTQTRTKFLPAHYLESLQPFRVECETVFLDITNTDFSFGNHLLHDGERNVLFIDTIRPEEVLGWRPFAPKNHLRLKGTVAYLSNTWVENYYHWMQLTLPLLRFYERFAPDLHIDYYYLGETRLTGFQTETLERFGIHPGQVILKPCRADRLLAALYLHRPQHYGLRYRDIFGHEFVRSLYVPLPESEASKYPKRIYIERGNAASRRIVNEEELIAFLRRFGFVPVRMDGKSVAEQARYFGYAEAIVGFHGAALTNLVFARPGAQLIEIFPEDLQESSFFTAASYSQMDYSYFVGKKQRPKRSPRDTSHLNTFVSVPEFEQLFSMTGIAGPT